MAAPVVVVGAESYDGSLWWHEVCGVDTGIHLPDKLHHTVVPHSHGQKW